MAQGSKRVLYLLNVVNEALGIQKDTHVKKAEYDEVPKFMKDIEAIDAAKEVIERRKDLLDIPASGLEQEIEGLYNVSIKLSSEAQSRNTTKVLLKKGQLIHYALVAYGLLNLAEVINTETMELVELDTQKKTLVVKIKRARPAQT